MKAFLTTLFLGIVAFGLFGCEKDGGSSEANKPTVLKSSYSTGDMPEDKPAEVMMPKDGEEVAVIDTDKGRIVFRFLTDMAPKHVENFKKLANKKFYDGCEWHRVIPGFMIQGGDPNTKPGGKGPAGTGGPGYTIKNEFNATKHERGIVSMARSGDPDSAGSQFYIVVEKAEHLDRQYTAFGQVVQGMDVADKIVASPRDDQDRPIERVRMKTVRIMKWPLK